MALSDPGLFLSTKLKTLLEIKHETIDGLTAEMLENLSRQQNQEYPDHDQSLSGLALTPDENGVVPVELLIIKALDLTNDEYISSLGSSDKLLQNTAVLLRNYRLVNQSETIQSMPEVLDTLLETLDHNKNNKKARQATYNILSQLSVPTEARAKLLWRMEEYGDYSGNHLAARYAETLYTTQPDHPWIKTQELRQKALKEKLTGDAEAVYSDFPDLMRQAQRIVFHAGPNDLTTGKIGFEYEGSLRTETTTRLSLAWDLGHDGGYDEIRKYEGSLDFGNYFHDLVELEQWTRDNYEDAGLSELPHTRSTMHIHLDEEVHVNVPSIGGLFPPRINPLGTWEQRSILPFTSASETLAGIALLIEDAKVTTEPGLTDRTTLSPELADSWRGLLWGHICSEISTSEGRLAALIALRDPYAMRGFNMKPLLTTFGEEVLDRIDTNVSQFIVNPSQSEQAAEYIMLRHNAEKKVDKEMVWNLILNDKKKNLILELAPVLTEDPVYTEKLLQFASRKDVSYVKRQILIIAIASNEISRNILDPLLFEPNEDNNSDIRSMVAYALSRYPNYRERLMPLLVGDRKDEDINVRAAIISKLKGDPDYHKRLLPLLFGEQRDDDDLIRLEATEAISSNPELKNELMPLLIGESRDESENVRIAAVNSLIHSENNEQLLALISGENKDPSFYIRQKVLLGLSEYSRFHDRLLTIVLESDDAESERLQYRLNESLEFFYPGLYVPYSTSERKKAEIYKEYVREQALKRQQKQRTINRSQKVPRFVKVKK